MNALFEAKVEKLPPGRVDQRAGTRTVFVVDDLQVAFSAGITGHLPSEALRQALDKKVSHPGLSSALLLGCRAQQCARPCLQQPTGPDCIQACLQCNRWAQRTLPLRSSVFQP